MPAADRRAYARVWARRDRAKKRGGPAGCARPVTRKASTEGSISLKLAGLVPEQRYRAVPVEAPGIFPTLPHREIPEIIPPGSIVLIPEEQP